jgi:hypothetical protein
MIDPVKFRAQMAVVTPLLATLLLLAACSNSPTAPAPAAALPDWSGVWTISDESFVKGVLPDTGGSDDKTARDQSLVPLKPKYQQQRTDSSMANAIGKGGIGNLPHCIPAGMPGVLQHPMMSEYLFTPGRVTVLFEDGEVRRIYTDGRGHPPAEELEYGYEGHSVGHWEGATLVVDTIGISPQADLLSNNDVRVTRNTHITERLFLNTAHDLQIDTVVSDDELFTKPYAYTRIYQRSPLPIPEPSCASRNRDNDSTVDLTPPSS